MSTDIQFTSTDVAIIGAGPVGLFAAFQAGMLGMKSCIVDILKFPGGQCAALYPEKPIYDIPAFPKINAGDLVENLLQQIKPFNPQMLLNNEVQFVEKNDKHFILKTSSSTINCKAIVMACGCGALVPNRPPLEKIEDYEGSSVFYSVAQSRIFTDKKVVIAGGGDSAADWAIILADIAKKVYIVHRRDNLRCAPDSANKIAELVSGGKIELKTPYQLHSLVGQGGRLSAVNVVDFSDNTVELEADFLLPFFGLSMNVGPIKNWGLKLDKSYVTVTPHNMQTSIDGIFAIGDIASYPGKLKLILTGFAEAATAMHAAYGVVFPDKALHFEHSTSKKITLEQ